jgi:hypothetical protein
MRSDGLVTEARVGDDIMSRDNKSSGPEKSRHGPACPETLLDATVSNNAQPFNLFSISTLKTTIAYFQVIHLSAYIDMLSCVFRCDVFVLCLRKILEFDMI